ncbi:hypothetical protein GGS23DRAFT_343181 [Durotheca rogersii]|uniref:uncharacterized protein n=1 Tax=Durotheca rogersii TaxID=419775 RepID=UPI00221EDF47|nr:uncharacterized protein GGS23DRAFT_343181 [Durotheca rogersii]KAI5857465.1 hypothetical protein GGS23DRAFT_343181 [Durotheca rogersii]
MRCPPKGQAGQQRPISLAAFERPAFLTPVFGSFLFSWGIFGPFDLQPLFSGGNALTSSASLNIASRMKEVLVETTDDTAHHRTAVTSDNSPFYMLVPHRLHAGRQRYNLGQCCVGVW